MPRGDRSGPAGQGPMTGRRAGFCTGAGAPGYTAGRGGGFWGGGFNCGGGRGRRNMFYATGRPGWQRNDAPPVANGAGDEKNWLKNQADALQTELRSIERRLKDLESAE